MTNYKNWSDYQLMRMKALNRIKIKMMQKNIDALVKIIKEIEQEEKKRK